MVILKIFSYLTIYEALIFFFFARLSGSKIVSNGHRMEVIGHP